LQGYITDRQRLANALCEVEVVKENLDSVRSELGERGFPVPEPATGTVQAQCGFALDHILRKRGALRALAQVVLWLYDSDNAVAFVRLVDEILPESYLTLARKHEIIDFIAHECRQEKLVQYYLEVTGHSPASVIRDAGELISQLANQTMQEIPDDEELNRLAHLLDVMSEDLAYEAALKCRIWADDITQNIDDSAPTGTAGTKQVDLLQQRRASKRRREMSTETVDAYIVFLLEPYDVQPRSHFWLSCWMYFGERLIKKFDTASLPLGIPDLRPRAAELITEAIELAEQCNGQGFRPLVEFILPRDQINLTVESWHLGASYRSLATQFPIVVIDLRRQQDATLRYASRDKWAKINQADSLRTAISRWIKCSDAPFGDGDLYHDMLSDSMTAIGLTFPPVQSAHQFQLDELLDAGIPLALWPHQCHHILPRNGPQPANSMSIQETFAQVGADRHVQDLPHLIWQWRRSRQVADDAGGIALLWDDPTRIVKLEAYQFASPARTERHR
jgi:hypothetical protein